MKWYEDLEYQLMCEKAKEIQGGKEFIHLGDWYFQGQAYLWTSTPIYRETRIWLPSQEDLQEIYCEYYKWNWAQMERHFHEWIFMKGTGIWSSRESALLAFVMQVLYQKKWNPEKKKWEKE